MTPAILGEFCARCGTKSTVSVEPSPEGTGQDVNVYRCPKGHGIQLIQELPPVDPVPVDPVPADPVPVDTAPVDPAPVDPDQAPTTSRAAKKK